jgi:hypothetical protein
LHVEPSLRIGLIVFEEEIEPKQCAWRAVLPHSARVLLHLAEMAPKHA